MNLKLAATEMNWGLRELENRYPRNPSPPRGRAIGLPSDRAIFRELCRNREIIREVIYVEIPEGSLRVIKTTSDNSYENKQLACLKRRGINSDRFVACKFNISCAVPSRFSKRAPRKTNAKPRCDELCSLIERVLTFGSGRTVVSAERSVNFEMPRLRGPARTDSGRLNCGFNSGSDRRPGAS